MDPSKLQNALVKLHTDYNFQQGCVHPFFHCSLLKPFKGPPPSADTVQFPEKFVKVQPVITLLAILDHRQTSTSTGQPRWEVLGQWQGLSPDETSQEDWSHLCQDYQLEDKVLLQGPQSDSRTPNTGANTRAITRKDAGVQIEREGKRKITKLAYLWDYV